MLGCVHEQKVASSPGTPIFSTHVEKIGVPGDEAKQKAHGVESMGIANKNAMLAMLVGLANRFENKKSVFQRNQRIYYNY